MLSPREDGFWSRGEHEDHFGTIIMFPERTDIWRNGAQNAQQLIIELANIIINYENVLFCVKPHLKNKIRKKLNKKIQIVEAEYDDIWARDISPNFVVNKSEMRAVCWNFNSWGGVEDGAYFPWDKDAAFAKKISDVLGIKKYIINDIILEGGAIIADGNETLYTTESVLLNKNRNPFISKKEMERRLRKYFVVNKIIWFEDGLAFDETGGHVDNICSVIDSENLCLAWTDDENDFRYKNLLKAYNVLLKSDEKKIHKIPLPPPQFITKKEEKELKQIFSSTNRVEGFRLAPSYINYYLLNSALLLPAFNCEEDLIVKNIFKKIFPDREIIQMDAREPLIGGGGFHCILHEIPSIPNI